MSRKQTHTDHDLHIIKSDELGTAPIKPLIEPFSTIIAQVINLSITLSTECTSVTYQRQAPWP